MSLPVFNDGSCENRSPPPMTAPGAAKLNLSRSVEPESSNASLPRPCFRRITAPLGWPFWISVWLHVAAPFKVLWWMAVRYLLPVWLSTLLDPCLASVCSGPYPHGKPESEIRLVKTLAWIVILYSPNLAHPVAMQYIRDKEILMSFDLRLFLATMAMVLYVEYLLFLQQVCGTYWRSGLVLFQRHPPSFNEMEAALCTKQTTERDSTRLAEEGCQDDEALLIADLKEPPVRAQLHEMRVMSAEIDALNKGISEDQEEVNRIASKLIVMKEGVERRTKRVEKTWG